MDTILTPAPELAPPRPRLERLDSVDLLRGVVMIVMALDHVRDFLSDQLFMNPTDLSTTTPAIFMTRWVTHSARRRLSFWRERRHSCPRHVANPRPTCRGSC